MNTKIISTIFFILLIYVIISSSTFLIYVLFFSYIAVMDWKKQEVEYIDVISMFLICISLLYERGIFITVMLGIITAAWCLIEFYLHKDTEHLVMKIGIIDFFYIVIFLSLFVQVLVQVDDILLFAVLEILGMAVASGIAYYYMVCKKTNSLPYLTVMYPMVVSQIIILVRS